MQDVIIKTIRLIKTQEIQMKSLFENGYLKSSFINPNYRGLVGWPCEVENTSNDIYMKKTKRKVSLLLTEKEAFYIKGAHYAGENQLFIPKFTPKDIPVGEIVFENLKGSDLWIKAFMTDNKIQNLKKSYTEITYIPYLIAETAERAQWILEKTDWSEMYEKVTGRRYNISYSSSWVTSCIT